MRWALAILVLISCNIQTTGVVVKKDLNYKTKVIINQPIDDTGFIINKFEFDYPEKFIVHYKNRKGKALMCEVSKTIYNVVHVGEKFDCDVLGKEALDEAIDTD